MYLGFLYLLLLFLRHLIITFVCLLLFHDSLLFVYVLFSQSLLMCTSSPLSRSTVHCRHPSPLQYFTHSYSSSSTVNSSSSSSCSCSSSCFPVTSLLRLHLFIQRITRCLFLFCSFSYSDASLFDLLFSSQNKTLLKQRIK